MDSFFEEIAPYAMGLSQFYLWSFAAITVILLRIRKPLQTSSSTLQTSAKIALIYFSFLQLFQAVIETLSFFLDRSSFHILHQVDFICDEASIFILYHFVLELEPVIIVLQTTDATKLDI